MTEKTVNVITIKWGTLYPADYVNKVKNMMARNSSYHITFHCFTDNPDGLDAEIISHPIPRPAVEPKGCFVRDTGFFTKNLGGLNGQRVFYFDLDIVVIDNVDDIFDYPKDDKFYIINDWNSKGDTVGQGSCFSWVISDEWNFITTYYEEHKAEVDAKYGTASQEYLSDKIIEKQGKLVFWPEEWFCSFRYHCMPLGILRHFIAPKIPNQNGLKIIVFHGDPNPAEAIKGEWPLSKRKDIRLRYFKRLYKVCKPTLWIKEYWH